MKYVIKKQFILFVASLGAVVMAFAQKGGEITITKEQVNQINQITSPARSIVESILAKDKTGTYARYQKDVQNLAGVTNVEQRRGMTEKILSNYRSFFQNVWKQAAIDEKAYQAQIRQVFPPSMAETIRFDEFLGFSIVNPPAPPPAPLPNKCIDICGIAKGAVSGTSYLISGGGGSYGNCYTKANAWGTIAAFGEIKSELKNNITIPGTFVDDDRRLAISLAYDMKIEATAFAVLGVSVASASIGCGWNRHYMMLFSPIIFATTRKEQASIEENFVVDKKQIANFPLTTGSSVVNAAISGSWGNAEATNVRWSACETK